MTEPRDPTSPSSDSSPPPAVTPPAAAAPSGAAVPNRPLDRSALERVIGRAAELQARMASAPELMSEAEILEVGREVGLSPDSLRQAMAEERTRVVVPHEDGWIARTFGSAAAEATRVVPGRPEEVLAALDGWMQKGECLVLKRRYGERITWERSRDMWTEMRRAFDFSGRDFALSKTHEVAATVTAVDDHRTFVRLDVDMEPTRTARARTSGVTAAVGIGAGGATVAVASAVIVPSALAFAAVAAVAALPVAIAAGSAYMIARGQNQLVHRVQLAIEQVLDRLEHGELRSKPTVSDQLRNVFDTARRWR